MSDRRPAGQCRIRIPGELLWGTVVNFGARYDLVRLDNEPATSDSLKHGDVVMAVRSEFVDAKGFPTYEIEIT